MKRGAGANFSGAAAVIGQTLLASGQSLAKAPLLDPAGPVALAERDILLRACAIMMIVVVPVIVMTFWFAWRYRASSRTAAYDPNWMSDTVDAFTWIVPGLIVLSLGFHAWIYSHRLDPYRPLESPAKPVYVEAVAQDWKWLFIYPEQGIASVNELAFPSQASLRLRITSDTVMNSFFIPGLGGQIIAMAGMQTQLNLLADRPGRFVGRNTQYSGDGFSDQHFAAIALPEADFEEWVAKARRAGRTLDAPAYQALARPTIAHPVAYYSAVEPRLFDGIIAKYQRDTMMHGMSAN